MGGINTVKSINCIVKNIKPRTGLQNLVRDRYLLRVYSRWKMLSLFFMETYTAAGSQSLVNNVYSLSPEIIFNIMAGSRRIDTVKSEKGFYTLREINTGEGAGRKTDRKAGQGDDHRADRRIGLKTVKISDRVINQRTEQRKDQRTEQRVDQRTEQRVDQRTEKIADRIINQRTDQRADRVIDLRTDQRADPAAGSGLTLPIGVSAVSRIQDRALPVLFCLIVPGAGSTILYKSAVNTLQKLLNQGASQSGESARIEPGSGKKDSLQVQYHKRMMVINSLRNKYLNAMTAHNEINLSTPIASDIRYLFTDGAEQSHGQSRDRSTGGIGSIGSKDERYDVAGNTVHSELTLRQEWSPTGIMGAGKGIKGSDGMILRQERAELSSEEFRTDKTLVHILSRHLLEWNRANVNRLPYEKISRYTTAGSIVYRESGEKLPGEGNLTREAAKAAADKATKGVAGEAAGKAADEAAKAAASMAAKAEASKATDEGTIGVTSIAAKAAGSKASDEAVKAARDEEEKGAAIETADDAAVDNAKGTVYKADHNNWDDIYVEYQLRQDSSESQLRQDSRRVPLQVQSGETSHRAQSGETSLQVQSGETSPQIQTVHKQHLFVKNFIQNLVHRMEKALPKNALPSRMSRTAADTGRTTADAGITDNTAPADSLLPTMINEGSLAHFMNIDRRQSAPAGSVKLVDRLIHNVLGTFTQKNMERHLSVKESLERKAGKPSDENDLVQSYSSFKTEMEYVKSVFLLKAPGKATGKVTNMAPGVAPGMSQDEAPDMNAGLSERLGRSGTVSDTLSNIAAEKRIPNGYRIKHSKTMKSFNLIKRSETMKSSGIVNNFNTLNNSEITERSEVIKKKMTNMVFYQDKGLRAYHGKGSGIVEMVMLATPAVAEDYNSAYSKNLPPITYKSEESFSKAQQLQQRRQQQSQQPQQLQQVQQPQQPQQQPVMKSLNTPVEISPKTVRHTVSDVDLMNPAELNRLVDKVYSQLETRLSRERRRFGY